MKRTSSYVYSESSKREIMQGFRILVTHGGDVWSLFGLLLFPLWTSSIVPFVHCTPQDWKSSLNKWTSYGAICVRTLFGLWSNRNKLWTAFKECQEKYQIFFASYRRTTGIHVFRKYRPIYIWIHFSTYNLQLKQQHKWVILAKTLNPHHFSCAFRNFFKGPFFEQYLLRAGWLILHKL